MQIRGKILTIAGIVLMFGYLLKILSEIRMTQHKSQWLAMTP